VERTPLSVRHELNQLTEVNTLELELFLMLAQHTVTGFREGLREGALLAKAWGFTPDWVVEPICGQAYYFRGLEALEAAFDAIDDVLDDWG
jgi:hypothetical protein